MQGTLGASRHSERPGTVTDTRDLYAHDLRHRKPEIGNGSALSGLDVAIRRDCAASVSRDNGGKGGVDVEGSIADSRAKKEHGIVEEGSLSLLNLSHLSDKGGKLLDVEMVESFELGADMIVTLSVGHPMVVHRLVEKPLNCERRAPAFRAAHDRADTGEIGAKGENHQVAHDLNELVPGHCLPRFRRRRDPELVDL